ncbi:hypothetical protein KQ944_15275 [Bacillus subtilis]|uniref:DUF6616 family protein n=1 Tax=Pseudochrobactrum asaccharolyticum TaxID=354351 RepID=UPI001F4743ED|nr:DUF6616 family protein [Pseudochrobactrum asaccharolyticum]MCF7646250.1 hypothetical protein [Pseudochrobactrum asaccharolyticum]MCF7672997.1 hypothetical protein [Bacillus subtilis]
MTHYLAELYSPKAAWIALTKEEKQAFFATIGAGMGSLSEFGIEPLAFGQTDPSQLHPAQQQFFAIWKFSDKASVTALLEAIAATGWHDYFDTINAAGEATDMNTHLAQLAAC